MILKFEYHSLVVWAVVQLVGGDVWVRGAWNAREVWELGGLVRVVFARKNTARY